MIKESLQSILHVEIYALIGFIIFFTFFLFVTIQAIRMKEDEISKLSNIPFEDEDGENKSGN